MNTSFRFRPAAAYILIFAGAFFFLEGPAHGSDAATFREGVHPQLIEQVSRAQKGRYTEIVASFDAYLAVHPSDAIVAVERCSFIDYFASSEENFIDSAVDESEDCRDTLEKGALADSPHARL